MKLTGVSKHFLNVIDKHFPTHHKHRKLFNRNTVKISHGPLILYGLICHINRAMLTGRLFSIHFVALRWKGGGSRVKILIFWIFLRICPGGPWISYSCMINVKNHINQPNQKVLINETENSMSNSKKCN